MYCGRKENLLPLLYRVTLNTGYTLVLINMPIKGLLTIKHNDTLYLSINNTDIKYFEILAARKERSMLNTTLSAFHANICTRIVGGQWRHKITKYGNVLSLYIHIWQIRDVTTTRQLFTWEYYYSHLSLILNLCSQPGVLPSQVSQGRQAEACLRAWLAVSLSLVSWYPQIAPLVRFRGSLWFPNRCSWRRLAARWLLCIDIIYDLYIIYNTNP